MSDEVAISWQGSRQLVQMTSEQYLNLSEASGFMAQGGLADTGAFTGLLSLFRDAYQEAYETVSASLDTSVESAKELSDTIAAFRADLRARDSGVEELMTGLEGDVTDGEAYTPPSGMPELPMPVTRINDMAGVDWPMPGPKPPGWVPTPSTGAPIELVDSLLGMAGSANDLGTGMSTEEDIDDFLDRHSEGADR
ncbi:hypothetical protein [Nocardioides abyssi]|uniref:WXG100 family type VII secretion target n=1 Tax=Nocardioides abyssi TaxID=3058370 RepID=A0ABT8EXP0_9ACTN|nr:hypothetical protein [Nocardioides abyssi]MDN4162854.1 hypothetical protein [Nocardioides abyssi]